MAQSYKTIIIPTRPHADVIVGIFLLREFGKAKYPDIENAKVEVFQKLPDGETAESLDKKGFLSLDVGGGSFDHHGSGKNLSQIIAEDLKIEKDPAIEKLLAYAKRDDKYGLGTVSRDQLDKSFGLSGLISSLNKVESDYQKTVEMIIPLLRAHYLEEKRRAWELPEEFKKLLDQGKAEIFQVKNHNKDLKVVVIESDNLSMAGWLKSSIGIKADVVCQKKSSGFVNILTKPLKKVDLRWLAAYLRKAESEVLDIRLGYSTYDLMKPGRLEVIPQWYYDEATNSVLNGGAAPRGVKPTAIDFDTIKTLLKEALALNPPGR